VTTGADLAETYFGDPALQPGDVVSLDEKVSGGIRRSTGLGDGNVIGVVSTQPALVMDDVYNPAAGVTVIDKKYEGRIPLAVGLSGRIPVNVSTENGPILPGDYLAHSSVPGVAMKAVKAGPVLGRALFGFAEPTGTGALMMFINNTYFNGVPLSEGLVADETGGAPAGRIAGQRNTAALLADMVAKRQTAEPEELASEMVTDRLVAASEIITPAVATHSLATDNIAAATESDLAVALGEDGSFTIGDGDNEPRIVFDAAGNATFAGTITADVVQARQIKELFSLQSEVDELASQVAGLTTNASPSPEPSELPAAPPTPSFAPGQTVDLSTLDALTLAGTLRVDGPAE
jgi:hypothetical protein